jgi:hypothetical protein
MALAILSPCPVDAYATLDSGMRIPCTTNDLKLGNMAQMAELPLGNRMDSILYVVQESIDTPGGELIARHIR